MTGARRRSENRPSREWRCQIAHSERRCTACAPKKKNKIKKNPTVIVETVLFALVFFFFHSAGLLAENLGGASAATLFSARAVSDKEGVSRDSSFHVPPQLSFILSFHLAPFPAPCTSITLTGDFNRMLLIPQLTLVLFHLHLLPPPPSVCPTDCLAFRRL